jgi:hypothetical protein
MSGAQDLTGGAGEPQRSRTRREDSRLLAKDPIGEDDTRRLRVQADWRFVERLKWAILTGRESPAAVLGLRNKRPS